MVPIYPLDRANKDIWLHVRYDISEDCSNVQTCNETMTHTGTNQTMYLYNWMSNGVSLEANHHCAIFSKVV